jgi:hypothetical protein
VFRRIICFFGPRSDGRFHSPKAAADDQDSLISQDCIDETPGDAEISVPGPCLSLCARAHIGRAREEDAAEMTTYDAREKVLPPFAQSDLRSELLYPDLHGGLAVVSQLQPVEKKLIGFSFGIGLLLLAALVVINHFFPVAA